MSHPRTVFARPDALAEGLAAAVADALRAGLETRGAGSLAVSGGTTPQRFFAALSRAPLDWARVTVTLVDERWVDKTSPRSNARLVRETLMQNAAAAARFVPLHTGGAADVEALRRANDLQAEVPAPFDAVVLGMGTDGHTASFFPHAQGLEGAMFLTQPLVFVTAEAAGETRITQTRARLLNTGALFLHIEGDEKQAVLETALGAGALFDMPVRIMLRQSQVPVQIYWCP